MTHTSHITPVCKYKFYSQQFIKFGAAMESEIMEMVETVVVNTGNILSLNDITKNPGRNPAEELAEAIKLTLSNYVASKSESDETRVIAYKHDDLVAKMAEHDIQDLKIGIKIFLNTDNGAFLRQALERAFEALNVSSVHNVILCLTDKDSQEQIKRVQNVWNVLESYVTNKKIQQIGLADIEENAFRSIYEGSSVKPSIIQINLSTCCVVPPTLQQFCKDNEVLLLTHSDPAEILPESSIQDIFGRLLTLNWAVRFLVHIKCRGVLTTKGYILSLSKV